MADNRGIFRISEVVKDKVAGNWVDLNNVWISPSKYVTGTTVTVPYAYFTGGYSFPSPVSSTERIAYATNTISQPPTANLINRSSGGFALGSINNGYFTGGIDFSSYMFLSSIQKLNYSNETFSVIPSTVPVVRGYPAAGSLSSSTTGYFAGGMDDGFKTVSNVSKITYSNDTTALAPSAFLTKPFADGASTGNTTAGYITGRNTDFDATAMQKLTYSTETTTDIKSTAGISMRLGAATGNTTAGYFAGGRDSNNNPQPNIFKMTYSSDSISFVPGFLPIHRNNLAATGNTTLGYFSGNNSISVVDRITYSTESFTTIPSTFLYSRGDAAALSAAAYGATLSNLTVNPAPASPARRFSDGLAAAPGGPNPPAATPTPQTAVGYIGGADLPNTGYFIGGYTTELNKISYASDTMSSVNATYFYQNASSLSSPSRGYLMGGGGSVFLSGIERITYSTDSISVLPATLSVIANAGGATGNTTVGYVHTGYDYTNYEYRDSQVDKLTYSSETVSTVPGARLSLGRAYTTATSSTSAGYFVGGGDGGTGTVFSTTDKLTYSSETTAAVPGAFLPESRESIQGTGTTSAGYLSGGYVYSGTTSTFKLTYSTDSIALAPSANLTEARAKGGASGNTTAGYVVAGDFYGYKSSTDKLTYSSETFALVPALITPAPYQYGTGFGARNNATAAPSSYGTGPVAV